LRSSEKASSDLTTYRKKAHKSEKEFEGAEIKIMRRLTTLFALGIFFVFAAQARAQSQVYTTDDLEYSLELPTPTWRAVSGRDAVHSHPEFLNGDRLSGYLRVRKEATEANTTMSDLARRDLDQKLRYLPGFVEGKEEKFDGRLDGVTVSYEFTQTGKPMMGRIYFLQADPRTSYVLYFTGLRDSIARIRNQTDAIARSFKIK
jgi:hypothetical protein